MDPALSALIGFIEKGGPYGFAAFVAVLWWLERADRKKAEEACRDANRRATDGLNNTAAAINYMRISKGHAPLDRHGGSEQ